MAKKNTLFSKSEFAISTLFQENQTFDFKGITYKVLKSGKPTIQKGECKTDAYVLAGSSNAPKLELKISIKQSNADFLENKMTLDRAKQIFGKYASEIIRNSIAKIKKQFKEDYLVLFKQYKKTEQKTLKIGWKFELMNKKSGDKSDKLLLTQKQLLDVYAGTNLPKDKKDATVGNDTILNSGIANYILIVDKDKDYTINEVLNLLIPIEEFIKDKEIYFACKAINFRLLKDKWDGNRPLAVYVEWSEEESTINSEIIFDNPLEVHANEIGLKIRQILISKGISIDNFNELKKFLRDTNYLE